MNSSGAIDGTSGGAATDLIHEIRSLSAALGVVRAEALRDLDLDDGQARVLEVLGAAEPARVTAGELSRRCRVTAGATTQRVARLERLGLVQRVREQPDRRTVYVTLTAAGRRRLVDVRARLADADDVACAALSADERSELRRAVGAWRRRLGSS